MEKVNYLKGFSELLYRNMTAGSRTLPPLYVIGAPKCGTTSLYEIMRGHPNFLPPFYDIKEINYLQDIKHFEPYTFGWPVSMLFGVLFGSYSGPRSYRKFFPLKREMEAVAKRTGYNAITGDFSPILLYCAKAAERIKQLSPGAKLIIMLRDPVSRVYSEYNMFARRTPIEPRTFEKAIADDMNNVSVGHYVIDTYVRRGIYEPYVRQYLERFPRSQVLIIRSEDFFSRTPHVLKQVLDFLDLPAEGSGLAEKDYYKNETAYAQRMNPETEKFLYNYYRPHNERLYELIGQDMGWKEAMV